MLEITVLKHLLHRDNYARYYSHVERLTLEPELERLFQLLPIFFDESDEDYCTIGELKAIFALEYPNVKDAELYHSLFTQLEQVDIGDAILSKIVEKLIYKDVSNRIIQTCMPVLSDSDSGETLDEVRQLLDDYDQLVMPDQDQNLFVTDDLHSLLEEEVSGTGLKWRLNGLNERIGELHGGTLGHAFARPETGKTTFIISEMSNWSTQLKQNEMGLWVNNEEKGSRLKLRWYAAVTGWPLAAIIAQPDRAIAYYNQLAGSRVRLYDKAGVTMSQIHTMIKTFRPRFVVIDQGDKVKIRGEFHNDTAKLGAIYNTYREWAKEYNTDILTVGQASAEAEGKPWLRLSWMNNSKTEKPGELDYAFGIGANFGDLSQDLRRYISICKNKLNEGAHGGFIAMMDPAKARYTDS